MSATTAQHGIAGYRNLVRYNPNFRMLWFGQIVSLLGDWFNLIASAALVSSLTGSGLAVGGLFVMRMLAPFLVSPFAGVAADRYNRRTLLIAADLGRGLVVLGFLLVREPGQIWLLYTLTVLQLGLSGFFFPARNAILPDIVARHELGAANALSASTWSVMLAFGAALGGLVAGQWGAYPAFAVDALTFFASAALIARIMYDRDPAPADGSASVRAALTAYFDGLRYLRQHADILVIAMHKAAVALIVNGAFDVLQVRLAEDVFVIGKEGGTGLGIMYAAAGVGTGIGPILARYLTGDDDRLQRRALVAGYALMVAGLAIQAPLVSFPVFLAGTLLRSAGGGITWVFSTQLLLQLLPDRVRGRVFSSEFALFTLMYAVSASTGGWLLETTSIGISGMLWLMAALIVVPGVLWGRWLANGHATSAAAPVTQRKEHV